jgi:hypothetical protein
MKPIRAFIALAMGALVSVALSPLASAATLSTSTVSLTCTYVSDACFLLPNDLEIFINDAFNTSTGDHVGDAINLDFEFMYTGGGSGFAFITTNLPTDFSGLTFTGGKVDTSVLTPGVSTDLVLYDSSTLSQFVDEPFSMDPGVLYGLTIRGTLAKAGLANIDISLHTPIPPALPLFGTGLVLLGWLGRRRRKA